MTINKRSGALCGALAIAVTVCAGTSLQAAAAPATEKTLHRFLNNDGNGFYPAGGLIRGADGNFYGTTYAGGANSCRSLSPIVTLSCGTVFKVTPQGTETLLYSFAGGADGAAPTGSLVLGSDGAFYGTTWGGGPLDEGTVFRLAPDGTETVLHTFGAIGDGDGPMAGLVLGADGYLYGTTLFGGAASVGTVFKIAADGTESVVHSFGAGSDGLSPSASLLQASDGSFYGTTVDGGTAGHGTVFRILPDGTESVVYSFQSGADGGYPWSAAANLVEDGKGNLYGVASGLNTMGSGTVFRIAADGSFTVLYAFTGGADGSQPNSILLGSSGDLYGTTSYGGTDDEGTVFSITPDGTETTLYSFTGLVDGGYPNGLIAGAGKKLYGTACFESNTSSTHQRGSFFSVTPPSS